jgi:hypothetical protein
MNFVYYYLKEILTKQLCDIGIDNSAVEKIIQNIKSQMLSLLKHWNDEKFRKTVLFIGKEEGSYYEPFADDDIRSFVVVTIRNSMLEILASDNYAELWNVRVLTDDELKLITSTGIKYFTGIDFNAELQYVDFTDIQDIYNNVRINYPVAWTAIETLANISDSAAKYKKVAIKKEKALLEKIKSTVGTSVASNDIEVILDGYDCTIDDKMLYLLYKIYTKRSSALYVDCFKMVSRNFEKTFRIMDFVLCCNRPFVTSNYYIENGYVSKRVPLIRPAHRTKDVNNNIQNLSGLTDKHRKFMVNIIKQL